MKALTALAMVIVMGAYAFGGSVPKYENWKDKPQEKFRDAEKNFNAAMMKLLEEYVDSGVSKEDLYRAATAGMLDSLNGSDHTWNALLTPEQAKNLQSDLSGQVGGIGIEMKFDETSGQAEIISVIANSPSAQAGLKREDVILSVDGQRYKGRSFLEFISAIRGKAGESVTLRILREDKLLSFKIRKAIIPWTPVSVSVVNPSTRILTIGYFNNETFKLVAERMDELSCAECRNLIIDLRNNSGGGFENSISTTELFLPKKTKVVSTRDRSGKIQHFESQKGSLKSGMNIVVITNGETSSGAELFTGALKEGLKAKIVGEPTFGKWNAQKIQTLDNGFAIKYSVLKFQTPQGHSYQNTGIKPDVEVRLEKGVDLRSLAQEKQLAKRLQEDTQLKAAIELVGMH